MVTTREFYGIALDEPAGSNPAPTAELLDVFRLLKPKATTTPLIRIGGDADGSYLVPDDLAGVSACFSPGANRIKYFEDALADRYDIRSHMCDFSCDPDDFTTPMRAGRQTFLKKWLDVLPGPDTISLDDWVRDRDERGDLLLQMDIEGAEYRNVLGTSEETLARFRVMVLEVHGLGKMLDARVLRRVVAPFFQRLSRSFTSVHAHPNNCCSEFVVPGTDIRIPNVLELTYVRTDRFLPADGPAPLPHPLDVSRNVPGNPPLFLGEAWCDNQRPLQSRVKMLEDTVRYRDDVEVTTAQAEISSALSLTTESLQTLSRLGTPARTDGDSLVEVAAGRPYRLSTAYGASSRTGVVGASPGYFFHTQLGRDQFVEVDLGRTYRVRRIEVTNRRGGFQERAKHLFAVLTSGGSTGPRHVFPMCPNGPLPGGAWQECGIDVPGVTARYVTVTSPLRTALHFADLRVYAPADADRPAEPGHRWTAARVLRGVRRRARRLRRRR